MTQKRKSPTNGRAVSEQNKDSHFDAQMRIVCDYLSDHIATASMVECATGVHQKNITRYKRVLERSGTLWELYKDKCKVTGHIASYLSCNPDMAPDERQLSLF